MNSVVHFDIPMHDAARAKKFYSETFGWELSEWPGSPDPYVMAVTTPVNPTTHQPLASGAINGGLTSDPEVRSPVIVLHVDDIDLAVGKVTANGGRIARVKVNVGGMGWYAFVYDSEGNMIGLWQDIPQTK